MKGAVETVGIAALAGLVVMTASVRLRIPAIVPLLLSGAALGASGVVHTADLGGGLNSLVELAVAVIIFEGALTLHPDQWRESRRTILKLLTVGAGVTFAGASLAAWGILGLSPSTAAAAGSILVVTGPTVVTPLLRFIRPKKRLADILRWEGIVIDPIGALFASTVLQAVLAQDEGAAASGFVLEYVRAAVIGTVIGVVAAHALAALLSREGLVHEDLRGPLTLAFAIGTFALAETAVQRSGLYAVTFAGLRMAALAPSGLHEIERFQERLTSFFLSLLFVLLAAVVDARTVAALGGRALVFLAALQCVRLVSVMLSTWGDGLSLRERLFLAWVSPRGVVAAAVASLTSEKLEAAGHPGAGDVRGAIFLVIVGTVVVQGATARWVARRLGVLAGEPREVVIVGAERFGRDLARELAAAQVPVTLVDKNAAKLAGLADGARPLAADAHDAEETAAIDRAGIAFLLAATPNDEANALVCGAFAHGAGAQRVTQLPSSPKALERGGRHEATRWPFAFGTRLTGAAIQAAYYEGGGVRTVLAQADENGESLRRRLGAPLRPLVVVRADGVPELVRDSGTKFAAGAKVIALEVPEPVALEGV